MIKGLAITPPVLGRISIGRAVEKNGTRLPRKDDQFTITSQVQDKDGWILHPLDEELRKDAPNRKLRVIPVRMLFNDADLNLRAEYSMFDRKSGRPVCVGNGETCKRMTPSGRETLLCPGSSQCDFGKDGLCKPFGRLNVRIGEEDELGTFIFRTTGYNSIRTLAARLRYYQAVSGNRLAYMPLELRLRGKSTTQSYRTAIYYVDLTVREGLTVQEAIQQAKEIEQAMQEAGYDQAALDHAARQGFSNADTELVEDECQAVVEEFYPEVAKDTEADASQSASLALSQQARQTLRSRVEAS